MTEPNRAAIADAVRVLNEAAAADRLALTKLLTIRVRCNETLADHPTVQVLAPKDRTANLTTVGGLGIINGLFGIDANHWGYIEMRIGTDGLIEEFIDRLSAAEQEDEHGSDG